MPTNRLPLYSQVRLLTGRFRAEGVDQGALGAIIEDYGIAYEVEFCRPDGTTIALVAAESDEVELASETAPDER